MYEKIKAFLDEIYGEGWVASSVLPHATQISNKSFELVQKAIAGDLTAEDTEKIACCQVILDFIQEFKGRGPFHSTALNPQLCALVITKNTFDETLRWLEEKKLVTPYSKHLQESMDCLRSIAHFWADRPS